MATERRLLLALLCSACAGGRTPMSDDVLPAATAPADASPASLPDAARLPSRPDLPDPLVMFDGRPVTTKEQWVRDRRPELIDLFQHYMYGVPPGPPVRMDVTVRRIDAAALGGKAVLKELSLSVGPPGTPPIDLLLVVPLRRAGAAPVVLGLNFFGNHTVLDDPKIALPRGWMPPYSPGAKDNRATDAGRGVEKAVWSIEQAVDRGWAVATFYHGDVAPDHPGFTDGIHPFFFKPGQTAPGPHEWGTIAAWAWGLHRAVDYLIKDPDIDRKRIAVFGHSRNGKTALLAAALDPRIAVALPHQSGCGGAAPSRGKVGETVKQINDRFPHWFCGAFKDFNDRPDRLPFDQHGLVALCAPRPVLFSNAMEDQWANPAGQFEMLKAAEPVYRLLGAGGLDGADRMPEPGRPVGGTLGFYIRPGKHSTTPEDWKVLLDFAERNLRKSE